MMTLQFCPEFKVLVIPAPSSNNENWVDEAKDEILRFKSSWKKSQVNYVLFKTEIDNALANSMVSIFPDIRAVASSFFNGEKRNLKLFVFKNYETKEIAGIVKHFGL